MDQLTMISSVDGQILLVGEGDFSFAVAMTSKLQDEMCSKVVATSIETEGSIRKHVNAGENIKQLKDKAYQGFTSGVEVRLSTDATKLHTDQYLKDKKFSRIIFNFPHSGGKSDLKRNRKLLDDFFSSACKILDTKGHVMVTLCKGQGGTPADQPMREWHDSWQVVSMAANSGFILVKTIPFKVEDYTVYNSTGFRSQDKGFHTDNAVTHIFEQAECVGLPESVDDIPITVGGKTLKCPPYLYKKLQQIRAIEKEQKHIIHGVYKHIAKKGRACFYKGDGHVSDLGFQRCLLLDSPNTGNGTVKIDKAQPSSSRNGVYKLEVCDLLSNSAEIFDDVCLLSSTQADCQNYHFASSLVDRVHKYPDMVASDQFTIMYGAVFRNIEISSRVIPPSFHTIFTFPIPDFQKPSNPTVDWADHFRTQIRSGELDTWELGGILSLPDRDLKLTFHSQQVTSQECEFGSLHLLSSLVCNTGSLINGNQESVEIGKLYLVEINGSDTQSFNFLCEINLSTLMALRFRIPDERFLWSNDYHVTSELDRLLQLHEKEVSKEVEVTIMNGHKPDIVPDGNFIWLGDRTAKKINEREGAVENVQDRKMCENTEKELNNEVEGKSSYVLFSCSNFDVVKEFRAPSLYPLRWTHDMSFWENEAVQFDVEFFLNIIRNIAGDDVLSAELIDSFNNPSTGRQSRCYRLVFTSVDKCLSYDCSWKLQSLIRLEVQKLMKITLR